MSLYLQVCQSLKTCSNLVEKKQDDVAKKLSSFTEAHRSASSGLNSPQIPPFHPTRSTTRRNNIAALSPLKLTKVQDEFLSNAMAEIREEHRSDRAAKRQKLHYDNQWGDSVDCGSNNAEQSLVDKLELSPDLAQVVASPGGLITYRNESFCKLTERLPSLRKIPLTIFELIDPEYLPQFYGMLALALHDVTTFDSVHLIRNSGYAADMRDTNVVSSKSSHLSITLPCKKLLRGYKSSHYNITVIYMNDFFSIKKCFVGIFSQRKDVSCCSCVPMSRAHCSSVVSSSFLNEDDLNAVDKASKNKSTESTQTMTMPCGKILQVDDDVLFSMIREA